MKGYMICTLSITLLAATAAFSQDFRVKESDGHQKAVLVDRETGEEYAVEEKEDMGEIVVTEIREEGVTVLLKPQGDGPALVTEIPAENEPFRSSPVTDP